jgi:hypothetical protein
MLAFFTAYTWTILPQIALKHDKTSMSIKGRRFSLFGFFPVVRPPNKQECNTATNIAARVGAPMTNAERAMLESVPSTKLADVGCAMK